MYIFPLTNFANCNTRQGKQQKEKQQQQQRGLVAPGRELKMNESLLAQLFLTELCQDLHRHGASVTCHVKYTYDPRGEMRLFIRLTQVSTEAELTARYPATCAH